MKTQCFLLTASLLCATASLVSAGVIVGNDINSANGANETINQLYSGNRGTNGGGDQSLQFGDQLYGTPNSDIIIGGLGIDVLLGFDGDDVLLGGTEDFNPFNRDRAFGNAGDDVFIWAPGDGNDFFDGGDGVDVLILGVVGESRDNDGKAAGAPFFSVNPPSQPGSQDFDGIFIDPSSGLPVVNALGPGFCDIVERSAEGMDELNIDHLVRFILRSPADAFDDALAADPDLDTDSVDTGLRIAVHLANTEFLVCASRDGEVEVFDLSRSPAERASISDLPANAYNIIN